MASKRLLCLMILLPALWLAACALSPQVVDIRPALAAGPALSGGTPLAVQVSDRRPDRVLGYRGGVYATASVSTAPDLETQLRDSLTAALAARGFAIAAPGAQAPMQLEVALTALRYTMREDRVTRTLELEVELQATVRTEQRTRSNTFRDRRTQEMLKAPSEADNERLINALVGAALQRLVDDAELFSG